MWPQTDFAYKNSSTEKTPKDPLYEEKLIFWREIKATIRIKGRVKA